MSVVSDGDDVQIGGFFDYIFDNEQGYAYIAHKVPENQYAFKQAFFQWPAQRAELVQHVLLHRSKYEVYYAPALFDSPSSAKERVIGARVYWVEFDGNAPDPATLPEDIPRPTLRIQSSEIGHEHWYWKLERKLPAKELEKVNRAMTYMFGADTSGWDADQILRPPLTFNHKRQRPVAICDYQAHVLSPELFSILPEPPPPISLESLPSELPDVNEVALNYKFPMNVATLFRNGAPVGKRSEALMALGYHLAEMNMKNEEMLALLLNADTRWGKFSGRQDQLIRLMEIVSIARLKYPYRGSSAETPVGVPDGALVPMGWMTLLQSEIKVDWLWDGWLQEAGYMLLSGPSGIGKTQLALDMGCSIALGQRGLDAITRPARVGFFSLEMNAPELKEFMLAQSTYRSQEELEGLEQNFLIFPLGEPLYLNNTETRELVEQTVADHKLELIVVDSMGSTTSGSLSDETAVKSLIDWNDRFRQRSKCSTWFIHHHRKASGDNKRPNKLSDVYGNQYITARATSVVCLWESGIANSIDFIPLKVRLRSNPGKFQIKRGSDLRFTRMAPGIVSEPVVEQEEEPSTELTEVNLITPGQQPPVEGATFQL